MTSVDDSEILGYKIGDEYIHPECATENEHADLIEEELCLKGEG